MSSSSWERADRLSNEYYPGSKRDCLYCSTCESLTYVSCNINPRCVYTVNNISRWAALIRKVYTGFGTIRSFIVNDQTTVNLIGNQEIWSVLSLEYRGVQLFQRWGACQWLLRRIIRFNFLAWRRVSLFALYSGSASIDPCGLTRASISEVGSRNFFDSVGVEFRCCSEWRWE